MTAFGGFDREKIIDDLQLDILFASAGTGIFDLDRFVSHFKFHPAVDGAAEHQIGTESGKVIENGFDQLFKGLC